VPLGHYCSIIRGFECGFNDERIGKRKTNYPIIRGEHIKPYYIAPTDYYVKPDFAGEPKIFKTKDIFLTVPKLVTKFVSNRIEFALDTVGYCNTNVVYNVHVNAGIHLNFLLGILNSNVVDFWFRNIYVNDDTIFPHIQKNQLESIPIPQLDLSKKADKQIHDKIVHYAGELLKLYPYKNTVTLSEHQRTVSKIAHYEEQINRIVYELYTLTDDEIKIIEGNEQR
jgi:hypothetical protein